MESLLNRTNAKPDQTDHVFPFSNTYTPVDMKLEISSLLLTSTLVKSDFNSIQWSLRQLQLHHNKTNDPLRAFAGFIIDFLEPINNYGCWCYFGDAYVNGRGPMYDGVDEECKKLANGYKCALYDGYARGEPCYAHNITYVPYNFFSGSIRLVEDCTASNIDHPEDPTCAIEACMIEGSFTLAFFNQFFDSAGVQIDSSVKHENAGVGKLYRKINFDNQKPNSY